MSDKTAVKRYTAWDCPYDSVQADDFDALQAKLREARMYMRHDDDCNSRSNYYPPRGFNRPPCSCGLTPFLATLGDAP